MWAIIGNRFYFGKSGLRMKIIVESSGVVPLGAIMQHAEPFKNKRVGVIFSGGNVDLANLPWM